MKAIWKSGLVAAVLMAPFVARGGDAEPWIHVSVDDASKGGTKVAVNLPLSLIDIALSSVQEEKFHGGKVSLGHHELKLADLRTMWAQLKKAGDAELVSIEDGNQTVKVERKADRVAVLVGDKDSGRDKVRVDVPVSVIDALLQGEGESLDLKAAISELRRSTQGEFIKVDDGASHVRIWIDERAGS